MPDDPNLRPAIRHEWRMAQDETEVHRVPADELSRHCCSTSCPCRPVIVTPPEELRLVLGPLLVPAVSHKSKLEQAREAGVPDTLPLDLYDPTV